MPLQFHQFIWYDELISANTQEQPIRCFPRRLRKDLGCRVSVGLLGCHQSSRRAAPVRADLQPVDCHSEMELRSEMFYCSPQSLISAWWDVEKAEEHVNTDESFGEKVQLEWTQGAPALETHAHAQTHKPGWRGISSVSYGSKGPICLVKIKINTPRNWSVTRIDRTSNRVNWIFRPQTSISGFHWSPGRNKHSQR